ncbi:hypothetical protein T310_3333 [Rasamsonia emersonii CBS 393.64]|uniref:Uncharacterized protein n=1 Tax=Rasamsonia emersonii (strain ATCC 16479 / CBS 393.64 / IMI 116815) TaxID=1408163 RepID=A0A0F4YXV7_RASE3|nr:hypothetical protein T310_3333 [Rasamsonia emersonii CBS 393.64]KKA22651.1 hypothetical protein T310_3333 [Rasamsonia emersonii CBS 393.64]
MITMVTLLFSRIFESLRPPTALGHGLASTASSTHFLQQASVSQSSYSAVHPEICPRDRTVRTLAPLLDEHRVMHVRGTPASGKTVLSNLLCDFLAQTEKVILIAKWDNKRSAAQFLAEQCHDYGYTEVRQSDILKSDFIFILDEAQQTYVDPDLWYNLIKSQSQGLAGPRFCLFSSYGSPTTGAPDYPEATTPPILHFSQRVSLTISGHPAAPDICLFYDLPEYQDFLGRFYKRSDIEFTLNTEVQNYIFSLTNGHPGMIDSILTYIRNFHRSHLKRLNVYAITPNEIQEALEDDHKLFNHLTVSPAGRSLPSREMQKGVIDPSIVSVLLDILREGSITFDHNNRGIQLCFRNGWVHTEEDKVGQLNCVFPSPLHASSRSNIGLALETADESVHQASHDLQKQHFKMSFTGVIGMKLGLVLGSVANGQVPNRAVLTFISLNLGGELSYCVMATELQITANGFVRMVYIIRGFSAAFSKTGSY